MSAVFSAFFVVFLGILNATAGVKVTVFYESLCPDSSKFITEQLYPHYSEIANYVDLELVPYGKANHGQYDTYGTTSFYFNCQHGPNECLGNKLQACALSLNSGSVRNVKFVNCMMKSSTPWQLAVAKSCADQFNMNFGKISSCASSIKGDRLLAAYGAKTPSISFVPTIVYDDWYDQMAQAQSLKNFVAVVCSKIYGPRPTICGSRPLPGVNYWNMYGC